jgi:hypothetical protein
LISQIHKQKQETNSVTICNPSYYFPLNVIPSGLAHIPIAYRALP